MNLFRHYTGRMAAPARWYLAGLGMFSLCLVAAHFSVQAHVQKNMRQAVRGWLAESGGSVNHVRYHLLRGVLTLQGVHWVDAADPRLSLDAASVSVLTSSRAMSSPNPSFSLLRFDHPLIGMPRSMLLGWLRGDAGNPVDALGGLLGHAHIVLVSNMDIRLLPDTPGQGRTIDLLQQVDGAFESGGMRFDGMLDTGMLRVGARLDAGGIHGGLALRGVPLAALSPLIGSAARPAGEIASGNLALSGNWKRRDVGLQGRVDLRDDKATAAAEMHAGWSKTGGTLDMQCNNVPLAGLPVDWPAFAGRKLTAGRLSGILHLDRNWNAGGWRVGMDGSVKGVVLSSVQLPGWRIGSMEVHRALLLPGKGALSAAEVQISDADLPLDAGSMPATVAAGPTPQIDSLILQHIRPRLRFADGSELALPELAGAGKMGKSGHVALATQHDQANSTGPDAGEVWKVVVDGDAYAAWRAQVHASHVPLVRLRPLLPELSLPGQQGVPDYGGTADFSLQLAPSSSGLQVAGKAALHDVLMTQGGDQLSAADIDVGIADAAGDGRRRLSHVDIRDWQYQMALHPLARLAQQPVTGEAPSAPATGPQAPAGAVATAATIQSAGKVQGAGASAQSKTVPATPAGGAARKWEIDEITAQNGRISLGQPDALIADGLQFAVHHLVYGKKMPFTMGGTLGGGDMRGNGHVQLQPDFRMSVRADIRNALPFAFNDWMQLSGMPQFVRGRMDADLLITAVRHAAPSAYQGRLHVRMYQAVLEKGSFADDPLTQRAGHSASELLARLGPARRVRLSIPFDGDWQGDTLGDTMGDATLTALKQAAALPAAKPVQPDPAVVKVTRLRLQGKLGFSLNERARLRQMARELWHNKKLIVELTPKLGSGPLDDDLIARVRYTQQVVERYLRRLGISAGRIFPVWPQPSQLQGDAPGLLLRARPS